MASYFDKDLVKEKTAQFYAHLTSSDYMNIKEEVIGDQVYHFQDRPQTMSKIQYVKLTCEQSLNSTTTPFTSASGGYELSFKGDSAIDYFWRQLVAVITLTNTSASAITIPSSVSYLIQQLGVYQKDNLSGDQFTGEHIHFFNYLRVKTSSNSGQQLTQMGISQNNTNITIAANSSSTFKIYLPVLSNINFCRALLDENNLRIKVKFQGSNAVVTGTAANLVLSAFDIYSYFLETPKDVLNNVLSKRYIDYKISYPIMVTEQYAAGVVGGTTYDIKLSNYKNIAGVLLCFLSNTKSTAGTGLNSVQGYQPLTSVQITTAQDTSIFVNNIAQTVVLNNEIIQQNFENKQLFTDYGNGQIFVFNWTTNGDQFVSNNIFSGSGQCFRDQEYKLKFIPTNTNANNLTFTMIFYSFAYLRAGYYGNDKILQLNKA